MTHAPGCHHGEPIPPPARVATWVPCPLCDASEDLLAALKALLEYPQGGSAVYPGALVWAEVRAAIARAETGGGA